MERRAGSTSAVNQGASFCCLASLRAQPGTWSREQGSQAAAPHGSAQGLVRMSTLGSGSASFCLCGPPASGDHSPQFPISTEL